MSPQEIVKKVLDNHLLPQFPYNLIVIEVGGTWYVNVEILVNKSKCHVESSNYDFEYWGNFNNPIQKIVTQGLELLGDVAYLNSLTLGTTLE